MPRLLVNQPSGKQEIVDIDETGSYFDPARVLWDTRIDGALPENIELGKVQRSGDELINAEEFIHEHAEAIRKESVPAEVLMPAARIAMLRAGVLDDVDSFITTLGAEAVIWWNNSVYIRRDFPLVNAVRVAMDWTEEYTDNLFITAKEIETENQEPIEGN